MESYDWLFEETEEDEPKEDLSFSVSPEPIWTTADGDKIPLSKMTSSHIINCIKLLTRKGLVKNHWYQIFQDELKRRKASKLETSFSL